MKLYIQRTNLKITWPTLTFYWQKAEFTLYSLNHFVFFAFLALTYYFLMSYLSAGFVSGVYRSCKVTILFSQRIVGPGVISNGPSVLRIQSSLCQNFSNIFVTEYL